MALPWKRLIRFQATDGRILRGEPITKDSSLDLGMVTAADKLQARVLSEGDIYDTTGKTKLSDEVAVVKRILAPVAASEVPILRCVGLNYATHGEPPSTSLIGLSYSEGFTTVKEAGRTPPPFPFIFFKPNTTILDHGEPVVIPKIAQDDQADYEGELVCMLA